MLSTDTTDTVLNTGWNIYQPKKIYSTPWRQVCPSATTATKVTFLHFLPTCAYFLLQISSPSLDRLYLQPVLGQVSQSFSCFNHLTQTIGRTLALAFDRHFYTDSFYSKFVQCSSSHCQIKPTSYHQVYIQYCLDEVLNGKFCTIKMVKGVTEWIDSMNIIKKKTTCILLLLLHHNPWCRMTSKSLLQNRTHLSTLIRCRPQHWRYHNGKSW